MIKVYLVASLHVIWSVENQKTMKNAILSSIFWAAAAVSLIAQPSLVWESTYHGAIANDEPSVMTLDTAGNVYVTGFTEMPDGTTDYLTIKYAPNGDTLWTRKYNGIFNGNDRALAIKVDDLGNVFVTGWSQGAGTGYYIATIKYNQNGVQQWLATFTGGSNSVNAGHNLQLDVFGNLYVAGRNSSSAIIIKYNSLGVQQWTRIINASSSIGENRTLIAINPNDGNIIVTVGGSNNKIYHLSYLNPSNGNITYQYNPEFGIPKSLLLDGLGNIYVTSEQGTGSIATRTNTCKYNYPGTPSQPYRAWCQSVYVSTQSLSTVNAWIDNNNNVYALGSWYDGVKYLTLLKKINASGENVWTIPTNSVFGIEGRPVSLALSKVSNPPDIYVTGFNAAGDFKTIKFSNATGDTLWTKTYDCGNNSPDIAIAMVTDNCDNIYITGTSNCNGTFKDVKTIKYAVAAPPAVTANGPLNFCQGGSVTLSASAGNSYLWSTGATTPFITVTSSGNYTVTVTNAAGCPQVSLPVQVNVLPPPVAAITQGPLVNVCQGSSTTLTASAGSTYLWSTGATTQSISVSAAGNYRVTVTNAAGCSAASPFTTVNVVPSPVASIANGGPTTFCQGGSVQLNASAGSSWLWSNGATSQSITVNAAGNYTVTVTNTAGCSAASAPMTVTVNPLPASNVSPAGPVSFCQGGSAVLTASAGGASYLWSNGATTQSITANAAGNYTVTVTSAAGCTAASPPVTVNVVPAPTPSITTVGNTSFCEGGSVILTASQAHSYQWSNGATTQNIVVSTTGNYTVTVTNAEGCTATASIGVTAHPVATLTLAPTNTTCSNTDGFVLVNVSGGSPIASFVWSNGSTSQNIANLPGGVYSVTATDVNGCTITGQATVIGRVNPTVTLGSGITINQGQQVTLIPNTTGSGLTYLWSTGATSSTITVDTPGTYSVTVTNSDGCTASASVMVTVVSSTADTDLKYKITVFPNPATDVLHIRCEGGATIMARLINVLGKQQIEDRNHVPDGAVRTMPLDNVPAGSYFIEVIGRDFRKTIPFVKTGSR